jgi:cysteinyl-tRNA synthetase
LGNFSTIRDVITQFPAKVVRFWLLGTHYRNQISFGPEELVSAAHGLERLETACFNWEHLLKQKLAAQTGEVVELTGIKERIAQTKADFVAGMEDDFNTPLALSSLYELVREVNRWTQEREFKLTPANRDALAEALAALKLLGGEVLGLFAAEESNMAIIDTATIENLIAQRTQAKKEKNWVLADQIRDELKQKGVVLEDTPQGVRWRVE